jgi:hypothetical protein
MSDPMAPLNEPNESGSDEICGRTASGDHGSSDAASEVYGSQKRDSLTAHETGGAVPKDLMKYVGNQIGDNP